MVIDRLSKYGHLWLFRLILLAKQWLTNSLNTVKIYGIPSLIISDKDKAFTSKFWQHLFGKMGTSLLMSFAYRPKTDGQTKVLNKCIEHYLRCFIADNPKSWVELLPWVEYSYNTAFHTSIGMTPFQVVYTREPPPIIAYAYSDSDPNLSRNYYHTKIRSCSNWSLIRPRHKIEWRNMLIRNEKRFHFKLESGC